MSPRLSRDPKKAMLVSEQRASGRPDSAANPSERDTMRRNHLRVIGALVLSAALAAPLAPAAAKEAPAPEAQVTVSSFSGAYLAGRIAESDNDLANAVAFYRRALAFDPSDAALKQSLLVALIATGAFDEALPYADALKT